MHITTTWHELALFLKDDTYLSGTWSVGLESDVSSGLVASWPHVALAYPFPEHVASQEYCVNRHGKKISTSYVCR